MKRSQLSSKTHSKLKARQRGSAGDGREGAGGGGRTRELLKSIAMATPSLPSPWLRAKLGDITARGHQLSRSGGRKGEDGFPPTNPLLQPTSLFSSYFEPFQCCPPSLLHLCPSLPQRLTHEETPRDRNGYLVDLSSSFSSASKPFFGYPGVDSRCA